MSTPSGKGDFVRLWTSAQPGVAAFISAMVPDYHAAEDILQECAAVLLEKFANYDPSRPFLSWAIGVCRLEILARRRRFMIERLVFDDAAIHNIARAYDELGPEVDERIRALRNCADKVQGRHRQLLDLRYNHNLKPRDIAQRLGSTPNATTVALARIRSALRDCIEKLLAKGQADEPDEMVSLCEAYIDQTITATDAELLRNAVVDNIDHAKSVTRELLLHRRLYDIFHGEGVLWLEEMQGEESDDSAWRYQSVVLPAIASSNIPDEPEEPAVSAAVPAPPPPPARASTRQVRRFSFQVRWWQAAAAMLLAVGITIAILVHRRPAAATFTQTVGAKWDGESPGDVSTRIEEGKSVSLAAGLCSLRFGDGTRVIVEGPVRFTVQSPNQILLAQGRLWAAMSGRGAGRFVVQTPSSTITDLGTEFGVSVDPLNGNTEVDVFMGSVRVTPSGYPDASANVVAGDSATVADSSVQQVSGGASPQRFVRDLAAIPIPLDVADLVSGGDGSTHRRGGMIDPSSGAAGALDPIADFDGDGAYHLVPSLPAINGCFVPDGSAGDVQVDSAGHRIPLPKTDGSSYDMIVGGNSVPVESLAQKIRTVVGGVDYSRPGHWLLFLHANVGLTFDLAAIRRLHPGLSLSRFRATVGNSFPRNINGGDLPADIYCIVDGVSRFQRRQFHRTDTFTADVPINDSERFLTIVTTDGGVGNDGHDILLGDCVLETRASQ